MYLPSLLWGTFHLSKLTGQKIPVIMIISLLIKTVHRDPNDMHEGNGVSTKTLGKKRFSLSKWLVRLWSGRSVLTFGKGPKGASLKVIVYCQFNKAYKTCDEYVWQSFYNHYSDIFISIILHIPSEEVWKILVEIRSCKNWIFCYPDFVQIVCHAYCHQPRTAFCWHFGKFFCIVGWRRLKYKQIFRWDKLVELFSLTDTSLNIKWGTVHKNLPFFLYSYNSFINVIVFTMVVKFEFHIQLQRLSNHPLIHHLHIDHNAPW